MRCNREREREGRRRLKGMQMPPGSTTRGVGLSNFAETRTRAVGLACLSVSVRGHDRRETNLCPSLSSLPAESFLRFPPLHSSTFYSQVGCQARWYLNLARDSFVCKELHFFSRVRACPVTQVCTPLPSLVRLQHRYSKVEGNRC